MAKRRPKTEAIEPVETHKLAMSIKRLRTVNPYDTQRWKRSLYHALLMSGSLDFQTMKSIREALNLP